MTTAQLSRIALLAGVGLIVLGATTGCDPAAPKPTDTPIATALPTITASPTPTPTPTAEPFAIACDTILSPATIAAIHGTLVPPADFFAKNASEVSSSPYLLMQANGGVVCAYSGGSEINTAYGYSPLDPSQAAEADSLIIGTNDHYSTSAYSGGTLYTTGMDGNPFTLFLITGTGLYLASTTAILDELLATIP